MIYGEVKEEGRCKCLRNGTVSINKRGRKIKKNAVRVTLQKTCGANLQREHFKCFGNYRGIKMLVDEMSHSFVKKNSNYNYSHCPLKKRPIYYTSEDEEVPEAIKGKCHEFIILLSRKSKLSCKIKM